MSLESVSRDTIIEHFESGKNVEEMIEEDVIDVETELCRYLREEKSLPYWGIADILSISVKEAIQNTVKYDDEEANDGVFSRLEKEKPWREGPTLKELHILQNMDFTEIDDILGCHQETVKEWVDKKGVSIIPSRERTSSKTIRSIQRTGYVKDEEELFDGSIPYLSMMGQPHEEEDEDQEE